jgi:chitinase
MASPNVEHVKDRYWYCDIKFPTSVASIPSQFFTYLFAAFVEVNHTTHEVTFLGAHWVQFSTFTLTVQRRNPNVMTLLSIGGVSSTSTFASLASHPNTRESFIHSSISLARSNDFHGLSLHWLYPSTEEKMSNLGSLLDEWQATVDLESKLIGNDPLLLVPAVNFKPTYRTFLYLVDAIARSLDWINLVAYEFYDPVISWNATRPFVALVRAHIDEINPRCVDLRGNAWIHSSVTTQKIVPDLPFYGIAWRLEDATRTKIFALADGQAVGVYIDPSDETILYNQIKYFINTHPEGYGAHSANYVLDYISVENTWIGYNDMRSITTKVTYAMENKLCGYYAWHVGDDRQGTISRIG